MLWILSLSKRRLHNTLPIVTHVCFSGPFAWAMAFSQERFQPTVGNLFLADVAIKWHMQGRHPKFAVHDHQAMGTHSDIHLFHPDGKAVRLVWSHPGRRPFGQPAPVQCPNKECGGIQPWGKPRRKTVGGEVVRFTLRCRGCGGGHRYYKPTEMKLIKGKRITDLEQGDWYTQPL